MAAPENVSALERPLARIKNARAILVSLDGQDRWGNPDEQTRNEMAAEASRSTADIADATRELTELVTRLRQEDPGAVVQWVRAHQELLEQLIATTSDSTAAFVARQELAEWREVERGERLFVEQNSYYVHYDQERYRELLGEG